jgi:hypothetical protein
VDIPYKDGDNHVRKGEVSNNLECLDFRWGVQKGYLGNCLGDFLQNQYFPLEGGNSGQVVQWCFQGIPETLVLRMVELRCEEGTQ